MINKPFIIFAAALIVATLAGVDRLQARLNCQARLAEPLRTAAAQGDTATVVALLRQGANPDSVPAKSVPSLWQVCRERFAGKNPGATRLPTPLALSLAWHDAEDDCPPDRPELARALLDAGADPNAPDENGYTPLMLAVQTNRLETARLLLRHGARTDIKSKDGQQALSLAQAWQNAPLVALLKRYEAH